MGTEILLAGHRTAYVPAAAVVHSHDGRCATSSSAPTSCISACSSCCGCERFPACHRCCARLRHPSRCTCGVSGLRRLPTAALRPFPGHSGWPSRGLSASISAACLPPAGANPRRRHTDEDPRDRPRVPTGSPGRRRIYAHAHARALQDHCGDEVIVLTREADPERPEYSVRDETVAVFASSTSTTPFGRRARSPTPTATDSSAPWRTASSTT